MTGFIVELCGLPGVGKSSLARDVAAGSAERGDGVAMPTAAIGPEVGAVRRIGRKLRLVTEESLRRPVSSGEAAWRIARSGQGGIGPVASRWVQWEATQRLMAEARSTPGVHLFDEGVTQALWSLGLRGDSSATLGALGATTGRWDHPDLIAVLDRPIETVDARLRRRGSRHSRLQDSTDDALRRAELSRGKDLFDRLVEWWAECLPAQVTIIRMIEGDGSPPAIQASGLLAAIDRRQAPGAAVGPDGPSEAEGPRLVQPT